MRASLPDSAAGKMARCQCGATIQVPTPEVYNGMKTVSAPQSDPAPADDLAIQAKPAPLPHAQGETAPPPWVRRRTPKVEKTNNGIPAMSRGTVALIVLVLVVGAIYYYMTASPSKGQASATAKPDDQKTAASIVASAEPKAVAESNGEAERKKREQQATDDAKRNQELVNTKQREETAAKQREQDLAAKQRDEEQARRALLADLVTKLAKVSTVESTSEESVTEKVVSQERVYFPGFNTPAHSAEENMARQQRIATEYPYKDGARMYKTVEKKATEKVQRTFLHIAIRNSSEKLDLANILIVATNDDKDFDTLDFDPSKEYAIQTGPLRVGQTFENKYPTAFATKNAYLVIDTGAGGFAVAKINGATLAEYARGGTVLGKFRKLSADRAADAERLAEGKAANAWRSNRDEVAARFVKHLVDDGTVISAKRGDRANIGNLLNYVFVFETQAGIQRTNRAGSVDLEEYAGEWIVRRVSIDGNEQIVNWPDK
jgi:hypothetical protein